MARLWQATQHGFEARQRRLAEASPFGALGLVDGKQGSNLESTYDFAVIQRGSLAWSPLGVWRDHVPHVCTSTLVWQQPGAEDAVRRAILCDPCLSPKGLSQATARIGDLGLSWDDIDLAFETHQHGDHQLNVPALADRLARWPLDRAAPPPAGLQVVPCPGHSNDLASLAFSSADGRQVWIVGDAILDEDWLRHWRFYWPNVYGEQEVVGTWRSVAYILAEADIVVPGHGDPIAVTAALLHEFAETFPVRAWCAEQCPDVADALRDRISQFTAEEVAESDTEDKKRQTGSFRKCTDWRDQADNSDINEL
jgi:glyoxylase-like metal-dependent hydrolase (beta-lactamase superfamily II)